MSDEYIDFGEPIPELTEDALILPISRDTFRACVSHKFFKLVELRSIVQEGEPTAEVIIVDCVNDEVPTKNELGILYQERLGLIFYCDDEKKPDVRALRQKFPATLHQNFVRKGEPASLCLYFELWEVTRRTWTPHSYLNRILWWLAETAKGTLHRGDQPVEPFYFVSPFEIVLPPDFDEKVKQRSLILTVVGVVEKKIYLTSFLEASESKNGRVGLTCIVLDLQPLTHGTIEPFPYDLEVLNKQFASRGVALFDLLCAEIKHSIDEKGFSKIDDSKTLLILQIPIKRDGSIKVERNDYKAFCLEVNLGQLGEACGVLTDGTDGKYYKVTLLDGSSNPTDAWHSITIAPIEVALSLTNATARQASGINNTAEFVGVLAGVGALGSSLAEIWYREAWGTWTFIDPDYIKPHNLSRHTSKHFQIGHSKANAVKYIVERTYFDGYREAVAIVDNVTNWSNTELKTAVENADLVIDATTTLAAPRDLAIADIKRTASVFLTPSGYGSVLLLEDADRNMRLDGLEAQYYGAILNNDWGDGHLSGHQGHLWIGAGCRDVSAVIPVELLQLHAANLARQVRLRSENPEAMISIWHVESQSGAMSALAVAVAESITDTVDRWKIIWNTDLQNKVRQIRSIHLPNETGGVLLGYIDRKLQSIFVVDILSAPSDSMGDSSGFTRGVQGLEKQIQTARTRTANIVSYIGEWHSHPSGISTSPSEQDIKLLTSLAENLKPDGLPGLILIVGKAEETWSIQE